jgi:hypothetical protein
MRLLSLVKRMAFSALAAGSMAWIGCGGGVETSPTGAGASSGTGGGTSSGTGTSVCGAAPPIAYDTCGGTPFTVDGTCLDGACAAVPLEARVYQEWKKQVEALSGLDDATFAARVKIQEISHTPGPDQVFVRIDYLVVLDWMKSRQADSPSLSNMPLVNAPTDAEIVSAVKIAVEQAEWTGLGALGAIASTSAVQAAFDACACGVTVDACHIDFENVTGKLEIRGFKELDAAQNQCKQAVVNVGTGALERCDDVPCSIN